MHDILLENLKTKNKCYSHKLFYTIVFSDIYIYAKIIIESVLVVDRCDIIFIDNILL